MFTVGLYAQKFSATITGTISDQQGAVIPRAQVEVRNLESNAPATTVSNDAGAYVAPFVTPGNYTVIASANGFKRAVRETVESPRGRLTPDRFPHGGRRRH